MVKRASKRRAEMQLKEYTQYVFHDEITFNREITCFNQADGMNQL